MLPARWQVLTAPRPHTNLAHTRGVAPPEKEHRIFVVLTQGSDTAGWRASWFGVEVCVDLGFGISGLGFRIGDG